MKTLLILLASCVIAGAQPTTNVYTTTVVKIGKQKANYPCGTVWRDGTAIWHDATNGVAFFYTGTNAYFGLVFTNTQPVIQWADAFGNNGCGRGSLLVTDTVFPGTPIAVSMQWTTNLPLPTNPVPLQFINLTNQ